MEETRSEAEGQNDAQEISFTIQVMDGKGTCMILGWHAAAGQDPQHVIEAWKKACGEPQFQAIQPVQRHEDGRWESELSVRSQI
ncbi:hypothetical protein AB0B89_35730 [Sphaerisporangium sp. NPDC049002]|uniref:hypothetical protein n=1 Tax=Sphaerisporangium sp. NPDC049002 TaxID=3155392 RepID=UPI0033EFB857